MGHSGYMYKVFDSHKTTVEAVYEALKPRFGTEFDAIAMRGHSGTLIGAPVAYLLNCPIVLVRKSWEIKDGCSHSSNPCETAFLATDTFRYVIIDDQVSTGKTVRAIKETISAHHPSAVYIGTQTYSVLGWTPLL